jgi:hypothetical protein
MREMNGLLMCLQPFYGCLGCAALVLVLMMAFVTSGTVVTLATVCAVGVTALVGY